MRYALLSDIHSNLSALTRLLEVLPRLFVDKVLCLGDIVGYGAEPNECLELVQKHCDHTVLGNHDNALIRPEAAKSFNGEAKISIRWTQEQVHEKHLSFLESLPLRLRSRHFSCVHATPYQPMRWGYIRPPHIPRLQWESFDTPICFIGHSHVPMILSQKQGLIRDTFVELDLQDKWIINVGSVGQPRDGDRRLAFAIYDDEDHTVEIFRLDYDYQKAVRAIRRAGLPAYNSNRLILGQ